MKSSAQKSLAKFLPLASLACLVGAVCLASTARSAAPEREQPNLILIMTDDQGYRDLSCYGHEKIKTPRLDQLAQDGIKLTNFYTGAAVCTPSRMALMTGAYPPRLGWEKGVDGYLMPSRSGLNPKALTMAEVFKAAGYQTGISGKWHLGRPPQMRPHRQGFDFTYYIPMSNNQTNKLMRGDEVVVKPFNNRLLTEKFTSKAIDFIESNKDEPFFLYVPYTAPHFPVQPHPEWKGTSDYGKYGDVIEEVDFRIGQILDTLKKHELEQETIVVFLSDNGPNNRDGGRTAPFTGYKWSAQEGGQRVPCIVRYPEAIPAKQQSDALIASIDLLPTLAEACNINLAEQTTGSPTIDGVNAWTVLRGKQKSSPRQQLLLWHGKGALRAFRQGKWKLVFNRKNDKPPQLFNLEKDPAEANDLSDKHPQRLQRMKATARRRQQAVQQNAIELGRAE
jgi:arylsulfatase A-like enzyme